PSDDDDIFEGQPQEEAPGGLPFTAAEEWERNDKTMTEV
ncbi:uncharacterized protein METZ01_LOCUS264508, partial [marine metagenome]